MNNPITAVVIDEQTIELDGRTLVGMDEVADAIASALQRDPNLILLIASGPSEHYKGIGTVIYASQRVGMPVENIRWTMDDGEVVSVDELRARNSA